MRVRVLVAGGALAAVGLLGLHGVAFAQEATTSASTEKLSETGKCAKEALAKGTDPGDCVNAPNPILPSTNELIWGALSFLLVVGALGKFAFPAVKKSMDARADRIRNSLDEAEKAKGDAQGVLEEYQRQLADAKSEAARIIEEARQAADAMRRELMAKAEAEAAQTRDRAQADIQASVERATADLRAEVARLSVEAAEMVLQRQLSDRDAQLALVEEFINRVGSSRA